MRRLEAIEFSRHLAAISGTDRRALRVLLAEDGATTDGRLEAILRANGSSVVLSVARSIPAASRQLGICDCVVVDLASAGSDGLLAVGALAAASGRSAIVAVIEPGAEALGIEAVRVGAHDYLPLDEVGLPALRLLVRQSDARRRVGDELERRESQHRAVVEALGEGVLVQDTRGVVLSGNQRAADLIGVPLDELAGRPFYANGIQAVREDGTPMPFAEFPGRIALLSGQPSLGTVIGRIAPDGTVAWLEVDSYPLVAPHASSPYGVVTSIRDVTERRRAEEARVRAERRERLILDNSADGYLVVDAEGRVLDWSPSFERFRTAYTALASSVHDFVHPDDHLVAHWLTASQWAPQGVPRRAELRAGDARSWRWLDVTVTNWLSDPDIGGLVLNYRDVTGRKEADQAARVQARLLDTVGQAIIATDMDGRVTYWNRAAERQYGWATGEIVGRRLVDLLPPADPPEIAEGVIATVRDGGTWTGEHLMHRRDGSVIPVLATFSPALDDNGRVAGVISVGSDISARVEADQAIRRLSAIVESSGDAIVSCTPDGVLTSWNQAAERLLGWTAPEIVGQPVSVLFPADRAGEFADVVGAARRGDPSAIETVRLHRDGTRVDVSVVVSLIRGPHGEVTATSAVLRDIRGRKALERAAERDHQGLLEAQHLAHLGSFEADPTTGHVEWSAELVRIAGIEEELANGFDPGLDRYLALAHPDDAPRVRAVVESAFRQRVPVELTHRIVRPSGEVRWVEVHGAPSADGSIIYRGTVLDITARHEAEEALERLALRDPLTGLANRALLYDRLEHALARTRRTDVTVAVLFLDIDHFKDVNDSLGHAAGDQLLLGAAQRFRGAIRPSDTVGRFGGDEFVVICEGADGAETARCVADQLLRTLDAPLPVGDSELYATASVGIAVAGAGDTSETLLRDADTAMYRAKARGRGEIEVFGEALRHRASARLTIETALRRAVERDEFFLTYQPIVRLSDVHPVGVEALIRWQHPERGLVPPIEFIPVAEDTGLIGPIGNWVLERGLGELAGWRAAHPELGSLSIALNVSAYQLRGRGLVSTLEHAIRQAGLPADHVHLEVTESVLMDDVAKSIQVLRDLKNLGVKIAVDDFGTGYSSLSYLKRLPLDILKIDRTFVAGLGVDVNDSTIVSAITALAGALDLTVLAEGVETEIHASHLRLLRCALGQGYLWSRPEQSDVVRPWLLERIRGALDSRMAG